MDKGFIEYLISRLMDNAIEASKEYAENRKDLFNSGRSLAYYEVMDIIKSELICNGYDTEEFGLDIELEKVL